MLAVLILLIAAIVVGVASILYIFFTFINAFFGYIGVYVILGLVIFIMAFKFLKRDSK